MEENITELKKKLALLDKRLTEGQTDLKYLEKNLEKEFSVSDIKAGEEKLKKIDAAIAKLEITLKNLVVKAEKELEKYE